MPIDACLKQTLQLCIPQPLRHQLRHATGPTRKPRHLDLVPVEDREIGRVVLVGLQVHVPPVAPQQVGLVALHREMGDLGQRVAHRRRGPTPAVPQERGRHRLARAVDPAPFHQRRHPRWIALCAFHRGAVDAQFQMREGPEQRLDPPAAAEILGRPAGELRQHRRVRPLHHTVRAHHPPGDRHALRPLGAGGKQRGEAAVTGLHMHEFIGIDHHQPLGPGDLGPPLGEAQGMRLRLLPCRYVVAQMPDKPHRLEPVKHRIRPVPASVGVDKDLRRADQPVIGQPFQQARPFVLHHAHDGDTRIGHAAHAAARGGLARKRPPAASSAASSCAERACSRS